MITARVFQGIFLSPPQAIGAQTVSEMFFQHEKVRRLNNTALLVQKCLNSVLVACLQGQKLGVWTLMVTLGPPVAPFIFGFGPPLSSLGSAANFTLADGLIF